MRGVLPGPTIPGVLARRQPGGRWPALALAPLAVLAVAGCSPTCHSLNPECVYLRGDPTAAQRAAAHGASVRARLPQLERRVGKTVVGLEVNAYGDIWVGTDSRAGGVEETIGLTSDRHFVHEDKTYNTFVPHREPFPLSAFDPAALDRILKRVARLRPRQTLDQADLSREDFIQGGLQWRIETYGDNGGSTLVASPDARQICLASVAFNHRTRVYSCPRKFGGQPPGIGHLGY